MNTEGSQDRGNTNRQQARWLHQFLVHKNAISLCILFIASFLLKVIPIMQYAHVGGDPFLHFRYAMALLDGKFAVPVTVSVINMTVEIYYPPLFHLISLGLFLAFPNLDPYAIMKVLAVTLDVLQIVPVYFIVKRVTHWSPAALIASYGLLTVRSDYQMLSWGGYANIAGLFFIAVLVYFVITDRLILSAVASAALALTHHLSLLLIFAILVPYFAIRIWKRRAIPRAMVGTIVGGTIAYVVFYRFALFPLLEFYSKVFPPYSQSQYVTPYILEQVGPLLLFLGALGFVLSYLHARREFAVGREILVIWAIVPLLLAYAYLFGVQWHGVRWIAFIPAPLVVWTGIAIGYLRERKFFIVVIVCVFAIQLIGTIQGYYKAILQNVL